MSCSCIFFDILPSENQSYCKNGSGNRANYNWVNREFQFNFKLLLRLSKHTVIAGLLIIVQNS